MTLNPISCDAVAAGDLDARYAAGELTDEEAESVERHFFACEECWTLVQRAVDVRAAEQRPAGGDLPLTPHGGSPAAAPMRRRRWSPASRVGLAAAAVLLIAGTWRAQSWQRAEPTASVMRAPADSLHLVSSVRGMRLVVQWARASEAVRYRARLYSAEGSLLHERELPDTILVVAPGTLSSATQGTTAFWEVQALDRTSRIVARSGLHAMRLPRAAR